MRKLKLIGVDYFDRYTFRDEETGQYYCDVNNLADNRSMDKVKEFYNQKQPILSDKEGNYLEAEPSGCAPILNYSII